jgi:hypothetical protein
MWCRGREEEELGEPVRIANAHTSVEDQLILKLSG